MESIITMAEDLFFRPEGAWCGDFIPFYHAGIYHLFYLHDWRDHAKNGEGTAWYRISTTDFIHFTEHGEMLARGSKEEQDLYVFTGSVLEAEGRFHIFYTGHNHHLIPQGKPQEAVMHAVSDDLQHWTKIPEDSFFAPQTGYEPHDWRDPFVYWNAETGLYEMLLAARHTAGSSRRRGCTALCTSSDLKTWSVEEPLYTPELYYTHECPDLFQIGEWWYLIFSEYSESHVTRYRMARSPKGPWVTPHNDTFDGRAYYAAKTAGDGERRYLFGWNATREQNKDFQLWQWGGNLVVHEIVQEAEGTLSVRLPESLKKHLSTIQAVSFRESTGDVTPIENGARIDAFEKFGRSLVRPLPSTCRIALDMVYAEGTQAFGVQLRVGEDADTGYYLRFEPRFQRMVLDCWSRRGDLAHWVEVERPLKLLPNVSLHLDILLSDSILEVYADNQTALSARLYDHTAGDWGLFVQEGAVTFSNTQLYTA